jgi:hypothetical protein
MLGNDNQYITKKSYWDRPDGKVGIIAGIFLAGYAGLKLLPINNITINLMLFFVFKN